MVKYFCDRCGAECDDVYYTVSVNANSVIDGYLPAEIVEYNLNKQFEVKKCFCHKCKDEIERELAHHG